MPGFGKLREKDALNISYLLAEFKPSTHAVYVRMLLYCFSNIQSRGKPCPYFNVGTRQMASHCNTSVRQARYMIETLEERGMIVNLGEETKTRRNADKSFGTYTKRTFWWIAEEYGVPFAPLENGTPPMQNAGENGTHQRASLSREGAKRSSADAGALAPIDYSVDWYEENGVTMPTPAPMGGDGQ